MSIQKAVKNITFSILFAVGIMSFSLPAQAAMVGTAQVVGVTGGEIFGAGVMQQKRDWVMTQLEKSGVSRADSILRVSSMTDDQVIQIHRRMDEMPVGAGAASTVVFIFVVLAITDLMGATDIFPFIRPMEQ